MEKISGRVLNGDKVTIITVCYNAEREIEKTILSVIGQTYDNIEYIVVDGKSHDATISIIHKYQNSIDVILSEPDNGIYDAMNKGLALASGKWICFMNAGDVFYDKDVTSKVFQSKKYDCDVIYGDTVHLTKYGAYLFTAGHPSELKQHLPFCHQSCFVKAATLKEYKFNLHYKLAADYDFFYNLYCKNAKFYSLALPIAIYENIEGLSTTNIDNVEKEYFEINGLPKSNIQKYKETIKGLLENFLKSILPKDTFCNLKRHRLEHIYEKVEF